MESANLSSCYGDPNFAIICGFFEKFGKMCGIPFPLASDLIEMFECKDKVPDPLALLHLQLLRKIKRSTTLDKWERAALKFCQTHLVEEYYEMEQNGYLNCSVETKTKLLKTLLEAQFDHNVKFKAAVNLLTAEELRKKPLGRDLNGSVYWGILDTGANLKVYQEEPEESGGKWTVAAHDRVTLVNLLHKLTGDDTLDFSPVVEPQAPVVDTGQASSESDEDDEEGNVVLSEGPSECENEDDEEDKEEEVKNPGPTKKPKLDVSEAIEDPVMRVEGLGNGAECDTGNDIFECSEAITEDIFYVYGVGNGADCETGKTEIPPTQMNTSQVDATTKEDQQNSRVWSITDICGETSKEPSEKQPDKDNDSVSNHNDPKIKSADCDDALSLSVPKIIITPTSPQPKPEDLQLMSKPTDGPLSVLPKEKLPDKSENLLGNDEIIEGTVESSTDLLKTSETSDDNSVRSPVDQLSKTDELSQKSCDNDLVMSGQKTEATESGGKKVETISTVSLPAEEIMPNSQIKDNFPTDSDNGNIRVNEEQTAQDDSKTQNEKIVPFPGSNINKDANNESAASDSIDNTTVDSFEAKNTLNSEKTELNDSSRLAAEGDDSKSIEQKKNIDSDNKATPFEKIEIPKSEIFSDEGKPITSDIGTKVAQIATTDNDGSNQQKTIGLLSVEPGKEEMVPAVIGVQSIEEKSSPVKASDSQLKTMPDDSEMQSLPSDKKKDLTKLVFPTSAVNIEVPKSDAYSEKNISPKGMETVLKKSDDVIVNASVTHLEVVTEAIEDTNITDTKKVKISPQTSDILVSPSQEITKEEFIADIDSSVAKTIQTSDKLLLFPQREVSKTTDFVNSDAINPKTKDNLSDNPDKLLSSKGETNKNTTIEESGSIITQKSEILTFDALKQKPPKSDIPVDPGCKETNPTKTSAASDTLKLDSDVDSKIKVAETKPDQEAKTNISDRLLTSDHMDVEKPDCKGTKKENVTETADKLLTRETEVNKILAEEDLRGSDKNLDKLLAKEPKKESTNLAKNTTTLSLNPEITKRVEEDRNKDRKISESIVNRSDEIAEPVIEKFSEHEIKESVTVEEDGNKDREESISKTSDKPEIKKDVASSKPVKISLSSEPEIKKNIIRKDDSNGKETNENIMTSLNKLLTDPPQDEKFSQPKISLSEPEINKGATLKKDGSNDDKDKCTTKTSDKPLINKDDELSNPVKISSLEPEIRKSVTVKESESPSSEPEIKKTASMELDGRKDININENIMKSNKLLSPEPEIEIKTSPSKPEIKDITVKEDNRKNTDENEIKTSDKPEGEKDDVSSKSIKSALPSEPEIKKDATVKEDRSKGTDEGTSKSSDKPEMNKDDAPTKSIESSLPSEPLEEDGGKGINKCPTKTSDEPEIKKDNALPKSVIIPLSSKPEIEKSVTAEAEISDKLLISKSEIKKHVTCKEAGSSENVQNESLAKTIVISPKIEIKNKTIVDLKEKPKISEQSSTLKQEIMNDKAIVEPATKTSDKLSTSGKDLVKDKTIVEPAAETSDKLSTSRKDLVKDKTIVEPATKTSDKLSTSGKDLVKDKTIVEPAAETSDKLSTSGKEIVKDKTIVEPADKASDTLSTSGKDLVKDKTIVEPAVKTSGTLSTSGKEIVKDKTIVEPADKASDTLSTSGKEILKDKTIVEPTAKTSDTLSTSGKDLVKDKTIVEPAVKTSGTLSTSGKEIVKDKTIVEPADKASDTLSTSGKEILKDKTIVEPTAKTSDKLSTSGKDLVKDKTIVESAAKTSDKLSTSGKEIVKDKALVEPTTNTAKTSDKLASSGQEIGKPQTISGSDSKTTKISSNVSSDFEIKKPEAKVEKVDKTSETIDKSSKSEQRDIKSKTIDDSKAKTSEDKLSTQEPQAKKHKTLDDAKASDKLSTEEREAKKHKTIGDAKAKTSEDKLSTQGLEARKNKTSEEPKTTEKSEDPKPVTDKLETKAGLSISAKTTEISESDKNLAVKKTETKERDELSTGLEIKMPETKQICANAETAKISDKQLDCEIKKHETLAESESIKLVAEKSEIDKAVAVMGSKRSKKSENITQISNRLAGTPKTKVDPNISSKSAVSKSSELPKRALPSEPVLDKKKKDVESDNLMTEEMKDSDKLLSPNTEKFIKTEHIVAQSAEHLEKISSSTKTELSEEKESTVKSDDTAKPEGVSDDIAIKEKEGVKDKKTVENSDLLEPCIKEEDGQDKTVETNLKGRKAKQKAKITTDKALKAEEDTSDSTNAEIESKTEAEKIDCDKTKLDEKAEVKSKSKNKKAAVKKGVIEVTEKDKAIDKAKEVLTEEPPSVRTRRSGRSAAVAAAIEIAEKPKTVKGKIQKPAIKENVSKNKTKGSNVKKSEEIEKDAKKKGKSNADQEKESEEIEKDPLAIEAEPQKPANKTGKKDNKKSKVVKEDAGEGNADLSKQKKVESPATENATTPARRKRNYIPDREIQLLGVDKNIIENDGSTVRQSRRIAQIRMKEDAERRQIEEIELETFKKKSKKSDSHKKKARKSDDEDYKEEKPEESKGKSKKSKSKFKFDDKNPWVTSSESESQGPEEEEEDEIEEEHEDPPYKSDHEFSPESDLEDPEYEPVRVARTAKVSNVQREAYDDVSCGTCGLNDRPEWILLCDGCDKGQHAGCLTPALHHVPEGEWYCPACSLETLISGLKNILRDYDRAEKQRENEELRKKRLAFVGISLDNVLPSRKPKKVEQEEKCEPESESESESESRSSYDSSDSGPVYQLRQRRSNVQSYRYNEYDELIRSAIRDDLGDVPLEAKPQTEKETKEEEQTDNAKEPKDEAEEKKEKEKDKEKESDYSGETEGDDDELPPVVPRKRQQIKKKKKKLNSLEFSSEEDRNSDSDFKGSTEEEDDDDDGSASDSGASTRRGRRRGGRREAVRRSARARRRRYDKDFINDDSTSNSEPELRIRDSNESSDSDKSWGRVSKPRSRRREITPPSRKRKSKKKRKHKSYNSDSSEKPKKRVKYGLDSDSDEKILGRRTRGKQINYVVDNDGSDSEEEKEDLKKKKKGKIGSDDSDEFVADEDKSKDDDEEEDDEEEMESEASKESSNESEDEPKTKKPKIQEEKIPIAKGINRKKPPAKAKIVSESESEEEEEEEEDDDDDLDDLNPEEEEKLLNMLEEGDMPVEKLKAAVKKAKEERERNMKPEPEPKPPADPEPEPVVTPKKSKIKITPTRAQIAEKAAAAQSAKGLIPEPAKTIPASTLTAAAPALPTAAPAFVTTPPAQLLANVLSSPVPPQHQIIHRPNIPNQPQPLIPNIPMLQGHPRLGQPQPPPSMMPMGPFPPHPRPFTIPPAFANPNVQDIHSSPEPLKQRRKPGPKPGSKNRKKGEEESPPSGERRPRARVPEEVTIATVQAPTQYPDPGIPEGGSVITRMLNNPHGPRPIVGSPNPRPFQTVASSSGAALNVNKPPFPTETFPTPPSQFPQPVSQPTAFHNFPTTFSQSEATTSTPSPKQFEEEDNGEFGGLASYFASQAEEDLDT